MPQNPERYSIRRFARLSGGLVRSATRSGDPHTAEVALAAPDDEPAIVQQVVA